MGLERIKTYEDLDNLLFDIDYETLSDDDIERLCKKVWEIFEREKTQIEATEKLPSLVVLLTNSAQMEAAARCQKLRNCTEKRVLQNIQREQEIWNNQGTRNPSDEAHMTQHEKSLERIIHS